MADENYQKKIPGAKKLAEIARLIHQEELDSLSAFKKAEIAAKGGHPENLLTFAYVDISEVPGECVLIAGGKPGPAAGTKSWSGTMVVSGQTGPVDLYRLPE